MGFSLKTVLLRLVQGFIIGAGGILPGISGGVLSVIFGIYRPVMEVLAHPLNGLRRHLSLLLPVGAGAILGFLCGGGLILVLFDRSEKLATCLFIGLILGTLPSLWAEAGAQGRGRGAYLSCAASFLALSAVLLYAQYGAFYTMRPGFLGFLFCGLLWGLSLIVPGMTSSSILMAVGLFTPMAEGFARLDMAVILPWLLGMALIVLTLARGELVLPDALPAFLPRRVRHRAGLDGRYHPAALRRRARRAFVPACRRARRARGLPQREATAEGGCIRT